MAVEFPLHYKDAFIIIVTGVIVALALRIRYTRVFSEIIEKLHEASWGDLDLRLNMRRSDVVGELAGAVDTLLASRTAAVYELRGLNEELERRFEDAGAIREGGLRIVDTPDMDGAVTASIQTLKKLTGAGAGLLYLFDRTTGDYVSGVRGESGPVTPAVPAGRGLLGWVVDTDQPLLSNNVESDERYESEFEGAFDFPIRSTLMAPVRYQGATLGILQLINKPEGFGQDDLERVEFLGEYIAVAIKKAREVRPPHGAPDASGGG